MFRLNIAVIIFLVAGIFSGLHLSASGVIDSSKTYNEILRLKSDWKQTKLSDSAFVFQNSDEPQMIQLYHEGIYPAGTESSFSKSKKNEVIGPFPLSNGYIIYRNAGTIRTCDSVQAAHILIAYTGARVAGPGIHRTKEEAKKKADSLCALIRKGKVILENVVESVTDDPGSLTGNKGNYGWFTRESGFIEEFKNAAFDNPVGTTLVIETIFGYHIIQVKARTKEYNCIQAWNVSLAIDSCYSPSGKLKEYHATFVGGDENLNHAIDSLIHNNSLLTDFHHTDMIFVTFNILEDGSTADINVWGAEMSDAVRAAIADVYSRLRFIPAHSCEGTKVQSMNFVYPFR